MRSRTLCVTNDSNPEGEALTRGGRRRGQVGTPLGRYGGHSRKGHVEKKADPPLPTSKYHHFDRGHVLARVIICLFHSANRCRCCYCCCSTVSTLSFDTCRTNKNETRLATKNKTEKNEAHLKVPHATSKKRLAGKPNARHLR